MDGYSGPGYDQQGAATRASLEASGAYDIYKHIPALLKDQGVLSAYQASTGKSLNFNYANPNAQGSAETMATDFNQWRDWLKGNMGNSAVQSVMGRNGGGML
jgi:GH15 family glucan-1,4-alpha-glucosidase